MPEVASGWSFLPMSRHESSFLPTPRVNVCHYCTNFAGDKARRLHYNAGERVLLAKLADDNDDDDQNKIICFSFVCSSATAAFIV